MSSTEELCGRPSEPKQMPILSVAKVPGPRDVSRCSEVRSDVQEAEGKGRGWGAILPERKVFSPSSRSQHAVGVWSSFYNCSAHRVTYLCRGDIPVRSLSWLVRIWLAISTAVLISSPLLRLQRNQFLGKWIRRTQVWSGSSWWSLRHCSSIRIPSNNCRIWH